MWDSVTNYRLEYIRKRLNNSEPFCEWEDHIDIDDDFGNQLACSNFTYIPYS